MGGAFIALADDATAAASNPAGLHILTKPEVSVEMKFFKNETNIDFYDNKGGVENQVGVIDPAFQPRVFQDHVTSLSFMSLVYPTELATLAIFRHELVNYEEKWASRGAIVSVPSTGGYARKFPAQSVIDMTVEDVGMAVSFVPFENFAIGANARVSRYAMDSEANVYQYNQNNPYSAPDYSPNSIRAKRIVHDAETSFGYTLGMQWNPVSSLKIGAVYKKQPKFTSKAQYYSGPYYEGANKFILYSSEDYTVKLPDSYGAGISYELFGLNVSFDYVRIKYSDLLNNLNSFFDASSAQSYAIRDGNEFHFGGEYVLSPFKNIFIAARAGYYHEQEHNIKYVGSKDPANRDIYPPGKNANHGTGGIGIVYRENIQLDMGVDISDNRGEQFSISTIYRF